MTVTHATRRSTFLPPGHHGFSVQFDPYHPDRLVCGASNHYGLVGGGSLHVLQVPPDLDTMNLKLRNWQSALLDVGIYDVAYSEQSPNHIMTACTDGTLRMWRTDGPEGLRVCHALKHCENVVCEATSVQWNTMEKSQFLSSAMDGTLRLWTMNGLVRAWNPTEPLATYETAWSPHNPTHFATVSGQRTLQLWDTRNPSVSPVHLYQSPPPPTSADPLTLDWNKYDPFQLITGSVDGCLRTYDVRHLQQPLQTWSAHRMACKRVRWSPMDKGRVASVGMDMQACGWGLDSVNGCWRREWVDTRWTEFVVGLDWHLEHPNRLAICSWDGSVVVLSL